MRIFAQYCPRFIAIALERHNFLQCACTPTRTPGRTATRSRCSGRRRSASRRRATATPQSGVTRSAQGQGKEGGFRRAELIRVKGHFPNLIPTSIKFHITMKNPLEFKISTQNSNQGLQNRRAATRYDCTKRQQNALFALFMRMMVAVTSDLSSITLCLVFPW